MPKKLRAQWESTGDLVGQGTVERAPVREEECHPAGRRGQDRAGTSAWCGESDGCPLQHHG